LLTEDGKIFTGNDKIFWDNNLKIYKFSYSIC
jgi:hypothetical protein